MAENNGNRLIIPALILSALGVIGTVFLSIGFVLNNGQIGTSQASAEEPPEETSWWRNARTALAGPCAKAVHSSETASQFLEACDSPKSAAALVNKGRALLITWDANSTAAEKEQYLEQIAESFDQAGSLASDDPEIAFYQAFVLDFKDFVLDKNNTDCMPAGERYEKAIQLYIAISAQLRYAYEA